MNGMIVKVGGQQVEVPALDHDAMMQQRFGVTVRPQGRLERRIVAALYAHLAQRGFVPCNVWDGEEETAVTDAKSAMELIFNLDEASVRFKHRDHDHEHGVLLVLGNGVDIVSDWVYSEGDPDGFDAAMEAFNVEEFA